MPADVGEADLALHARQGLLVVGAQGEVHPAGAHALPPRVGQRADGLVGDDHGQVGHGRRSSAAGCGRQGEAGDVGLQDGERVRRQHHGHPTRAGAQVDRARRDRLRLGRGVHRRDGRSAEQPAAHRRDVGTAQVERHLHRLLEVGVGERHVAPSVADAGGGGQRRDPPVADLADQVRRPHVRRHRRRVLVHLVHLEHVVGRGAHQRAGLLVGQEHRLEHVDGLRDVRHDQPVREPVEHVQVQRGHHRVAHRVLLVQEAGVGARLDVPPGAPLVQDQPDPALRVVPVHHRDVPAQQRLDVPGRRRRCASSRPRRTRWRCPCPSRCRRSCSSARRRPGTAARGTARGPASATAFISASVHSTSQSDAPAAIRYRTLPPWSRQ